MPGMTGTEATRNSVPDDESRFVHPVREASEEEQISLYATALDIAVRFMFTNNLYTFGGRVYLQHNSGPIGLRVTMAVARLVMLEWGEHMREILTKADIKTYLEGVYVDDTQDSSVYYLVIVFLQVTRAETTSVK